MNKSNIEKQSAGTKADSNSTAQNHSVSQPNANTNVVGSLFKSREIKFRVWDNELKIWIWNLGMKQNNVLSSGKEKGRFSIIQYTGLRDKNGKDIYEGDILFYEGVTSFGEKVIRTVSFNKERAQFMSGMYTLYDISIVQPVIIGNIFENPELLETLR